MNIILSSHSLKKSIEVLSEVVKVDFSLAYKASLKKLKHLINLLSPELKEELRIGSFDELSKEEINKEIERLNKEFLHYDLVKHFIDIRRQLSLCLNISKFISSLQKLLRYLTKIKYNYNINRRSFIRKIFNFHFKNLDDYHSFSIL